MGWSNQTFLMAALASGLASACVSAQSGSSPVRLGQPVPDRSANWSAPDQTVQQVQYQQPAQSGGIRLVQSEAPVPPSPVLQSGPASAPPPAFGAPPGSVPAGAFNPNQPLAGQGGTQFFSQAGEYLGITGCTPGRRWFQSDHGFDQMISPVTNPFFFEDPRALTEVRPIFIYQAIPGSSPVASGSLFWYGTQLRPALTEKISLTINKLGGIGATGSATAPLDRSEEHTSELQSH